ncbi:hypothetical protein NDU88_001538 [Pleurodeles waltl]|uniref:Uncharacterized protein n=1 Tax=Pleurodeles waltl TaxID=8319 RepID=A0AAV7WPM1_PLEWA|nr:hypothetical protein NDU88_001538 [Pleurodeles waltl]
MVSMAAETKSIRTEIASFQTRVLGLEHRVSTVEAHASFQDRDEELLFLRSKLMDLEDRSRRDNARQLIQKARTQGHCQLDGHAIRISADFSKETSDRRRAFLALRPQLRQLEVKYGLFDPARMWITKNALSKDFYNPEDLRGFLDGLSLTEYSTLTPHRDMMATDQNTSLQDLAPGGSGFDHQSVIPCPGGQDLERLLHSYDDRGQVLHAWRSIHKWRIETNPAPL